MWSDGVASESRGTMTNTPPLAIRAGLLAAMTALFGLGAQAAPENEIQRGEYLVNSVMACQGCHTPFGPNGPIAEKRFSGGSQTFDFPDFTVKGANITPDKETGIGAWSDADLRRALVDGVRPDGRPLVLMPSGFYKALTPSDLEAVVVYLRSVPPVSHAVDPPVLRAPPRRVRRRTMRCVRVLRGVTSFSAAFISPRSGTAWRAMHAALTGAMISCAAWAAAATS